MLTDSPITSQPVGKTFSIAIGTLGVGAILQLVLIATAFIKGVRPGELVAPAKPVLAHVAGNVPSTPIALNLSAGLISEPPQTQTTLAEPTPPKPTPVVAGRATAPE